MSPLSGRPYDRAALAEALDGSSTASEVLPYIVPQRDLPDEMRNWTGNRILVLEKEMRGDEIGTFFGGDASEPGDVARRPDFLHSHYMTEETIRLLALGSTIPFLAARQEAIRSHLHTFLERMREWGFEDTPPLQTLIMDDIDDGEDDDEPR
jgi:hypothetical protein